VAMLPEGEKLKEGIDSGVFAGIGHAAERSHHVEVFLASEIRIEIASSGT